MDIVDAATEIERLRAALREITELRAEDMPHATEHSMAAAMAKAALHFSAVRGTEMSSTATLNIQTAPKPKGWCKENGIEHSWRDGPSLTSNPPIPTRECVNCGQRQWFKPGEWQDA